jgi:carbonic anhydrase
MTDQGEHSLPTTDMDYQTLLDNNARWVREATAREPEFFRNLAAVHQPRFLWIGCSDARVPANVVTGTSAGEMFVHRNIANQVMPTDPNVLAVLQYAVEALGVQDVIICGHQGCGGVRAALAGSAPLPHVDGWLSNLRMVARLHDEELSRIADVEERTQRLVELNVVEQVYNLSRTPVVQGAWADGRELRLHGWVYRLDDGRLRDLGVTLTGAPPTARPALAPDPDRGAPRPRPADVPVPAARVW